MRRYSAASRAISRAIFRACDCIVFRAGRCCRREHERRSAAG
jgi:hypothetical protein